MREACIVTIGDELLQGYTIDTNSAWLGKNLNNYCREGYQDVYGNCIDLHVRGDYIYDEDNVTLLFDVYEYDYGLDGIPGDSWIDRAGDGTFSYGERLCSIEETD